MDAAQARYGHDAVELERRMWHQPNKILGAESVVPTSLDKSNDSFVIDKGGADSEKKDDGIWSILSEELDVPMDAAFEAELVHTFFPFLCSD